MGDHAITWLNEHRSSGVEITPTFDELFSEHHKKVFLTAYRVTGNLQDAEDILQSVFLRLLNRGERAVFADSSAAYLCRAAINASIDLLRSRQRVQIESLNEEIHASSLGAADSEAHQAELRNRLRTALLSLGKRAAEVFALSVFEEFSNVEIANLLDTSSNSVAVTLHRARAQLQEILGELEGENR